MNDVWVIIAAYNEEKHLGDVLKDVRKYAKNVVVVDDGSKDKTAEIAKKQATLLRHVVNLGKGAAIKTGCDYALKKGAKVLILMDADGQHEPQDIPRILGELKDKDIVFTYRKTSKQMPFVFRFGNWVINTTTYLLYGLKINDTQCGYRALTTDAYKQVRWNAKDYVMESEMIANAGKVHLKYGQLPIRTIYRDRYKGTTVF